MSKRIILLISSLAVIIGLMATSSSYAWFATSVGKKQSISVSLVSSVHSAELADIDAPYHTVIMQGDNLVSLDGKSAMLQLENKSTTETQLRISIEYTSYRSGTAEQVVYSASDDDDITVDFAQSKWAKNVNVNGNCYFYYVGGNYIGDTISNINEVPSIDASVSEIPVISKIAYKDNISSAYSGQPINVKVKFESKQAENVTWSAIDSYNVSGVGK